MRHMATSVGVTTAHVSTYGSDASRRVFSANLDDESVEIGFTRESTCSDPGKRKIS